MLKYLFIRQIQLFINEALILERNMNLVDVHAHLWLIGEGERKLAVARAVEKGVKAIINNSVDAASIRKSLQLQQQFRIVKAALGLYPIDALKMADSEIDSELKFMQGNSDSFVAFGEIGLDYQETDDRKRQQGMFEKQLRLAKKLNKPVIVHSRKAEKEVVETLISSGCKNVILHAFHGGMKLVKAGVDSGFSFSIPSNIMRSSHFQSVAKAVPLERLFTETDAPFLGPFEDKRSEPAYVEISVRKIAEIKKMAADAVAGQLYENYLEMFK